MVGELAWNVFYKTKESQDERIEFKSEYFKNWPCGQQCVFVSAHQLSLVHRLWPTRT